MVDGGGALQRLGPLAVLPSVLEELGTGIGPVLEGTPLSPRDFSPETRIPIGLAGEILDRSARLSGRADIGLLVGMAADHRAMGEIGDLMACAPTLRLAIEDYVGLQIGYSRAASVSLQRYGSDFALGYGVYHGLGAGLRQIYDIALTTGGNILKGLTGGRARAHRVHLCLRPPSDPSAYVRAMGLLPQFDREQAFLVISEADMDLPLPGADPARRQSLLRLVGERLGIALVEPAARVRHVLRPRLLLGEGDLASVAREFGLHRRTLERRLARSGTTFETIRDEVRSAIARELLHHTDMPISRISDALSYSTHSAFIHAFNRWTGMPPRAWRASAARAERQAYDAG